MLRPTFSIMRTFKQSIDQSAPRFSGIVLPVVQKSHYLGGLGRQPKQVIGRSSNKHPRLGLRSCIITSITPAGINEEIHRMLPIGDVASNYRAKTPEIFREITAIRPLLTLPSTCLENLSLGSHCNSPLCVGVITTPCFVGPWRSGRDPMTKIFDLSRSQSVVFFWRHLQVLVFPGNRPIKITLPRLALHQNPRGALPALQHPLTAK